MPPGVQTIKFESDLASCSPPPVGTRFFYLRTLLDLRKLINDKKKLPLRFTGSDTSYSSTSIFLKMGRQGIKKTPGEYETTISASCSVGMMYGNKDGGTRDWVARRLPDILRILVLYSPFTIRTGRKATDRYLLFMSNLIEI